MTNNDEKINKLLADKEFFKKITSMKTAEEVQSAFEKAGAEVSIEEVQEIGTMINEVVEELNEGKLENVSGGGRDNARQLIEGFYSGLLGPGYAYSSANYDTKPKNKSQKEDRHTGIACGVMAANMAIPITWTVGAIIGAVEDTKKNKK